MRYCFVLIDQKKRSLYTILELSEGSFFSYCFQNLRLYNWRKQIDRFCLFTVLILNNRFETGSLL
jgi:hypothetical protein